MSRNADLHPPKMLQCGRMAALAKLRRSADDYRGWLVWAESDIASLVGLGGRLQFAVYSSKRLRRWSDLSVQSSRPQQLLTL
jgi:hypothetical protein